AVIAAASAIVGALRVSRAVRKFFIGRDVTRPASARSPRRRQRAYPWRVTSTRPVLVVDLGANSAQTIARRVREAHVYSQIVPPADASVLLDHAPVAVIYAGGEGALPAASARSEEHTSELSHVSTSYA